MERERKMTDTDRLHDEGPFVRYNDHAAKVAELERENEQMTTEMDFLYFACSILQFIACIFWTVWAIWHWGL
jgi:hypothetical protein